MTNRRAIPSVAVESQWQTADGWPLRRIDWPAPKAGGKGSVLFLPGRGDFYEKYLETLDHWHALGWHVTAADWRGQAGSGRLGRDGVTGHIDDFSTWVADLADLWRDWRAATPGPHVLAGHSMGGHLVLRAVAEGAVDPDGVLLSAPMLGFTADVLPGAVMHGAARVLAALGDPARPAWRWSEKPGQPPEGRADLLTHDAVRYADELWWRDARPELVMGPGSWRWVERAYASMRKVFARGVLEQVHQPVLLLATDHDQLVGYRAIVRAAARLPHATLINYGAAAAHELLREVDPVRDRVLADADAFLGQIAARKPVAGSPPA
ncbi:MAG: hypothetical protein RLZZ427_648 [Pseudomonadota bacterium]|jgi:lysophospholipase